MQRGGGQRIRPPGARRARISQRQAKPGEGGLAGSAGSGRRMRTLVRAVKLLAAIVAVIVAADGLPRARSTLGWKVK